MNIYLYFICILIFAFSCSTKHKSTKNEITDNVEHRKLRVNDITKCVKTLSISDSICICFTKSDSIKFKLYYNPLIFINQSQYKIEGFDSLVGSSLDDFLLSPNHQYVLLDYIDVGFVGEYPEQLYNEHYSCIIIDVLTHKVVEFMTADCDGMWNKNNEWVNNNGVVIFTNEKTKSREH